MANNLFASVPGKHDQPRRQQRRAKRMQRLRTYLVSFGFLLLAAGILWVWAARLSPPKPPLPSVILVPLDSRPVNTDLPAQLAAIAGISVTMPNQESLDQFLAPGKSQALFSWLAGRNESGYGVTILHINELLFGGLLHSRESAQYLDAAVKLQSLHDYLLRRERLSGNELILVYILPRLLPSQYDEDMWVYEKELPALSQLKHRQALEPGNADLAEQIRVLEGSIPREIKQRYELVYTEAFNTGLSLLDWLDRGLADEVVIGLDDSAEYGFSVKAFRDLKSRAAQSNQGRAYFLHGADELTPLIIARHCLDYGGGSESFALRYLSEEGVEALLPYEALPLADNFREKAAYLYDGKSRGSGKQKYIYLFTDQNAHAEELKETWRKLRADRARFSGALLGLADVAKPNGAWTPLIENAGPDRVYDYVDAYAGWNTAGNSLGSVMAHLLYWEYAQSFSGQERKDAVFRHKSLQKLRIIDDYFFQSIVRQELIGWTVEEGFPYLTFGSRWMEANDMLQDMMEKALMPWPKLKPPTSPGQSGQPLYQFRFPWPRSFEIRVSVSMRDALAK